MKALVIDDSRAIRSVIGRTLKSLGFAVCEAGDGQQGLEQLSAEPDVTVVLVDWNMPVMNGLEFVKSMRAQKQYDGTPILMVTTETEIEQMILALEAGANEYLMKPFTPEALGEKLGMLGVKAA